MSSFMDLDGTAERQTGDSGHQQQQQQQKYLVKPLNNHTAMNKVWNKDWEWGENKKMAKLVKERRRRRRRRWRRQQIWIFVCGWCVVVFVVVVNVVLLDLPATELNRLLHHICLFYIRLIKNLVEFDFFFSSSFWRGFFFLFSISLYLVSLFSSFVEFFFCCCLSFGFVCLFVEFAVLFQAACQFYGEFNKLFKLKNRSSNL